jgi:diadenylate cyclase
MPVPGVIMVEFGWRDAVEILITTGLFYVVYRLFRRVRGSRILAEFLLVLAGLAVVAKLLDLQALNWVVRSVSAFGIVALLVAFQPELRRALVELEGLNLFSRKRERGDLAAEMAEIVRQLSAKRFGALFALHRSMDLGDYLETGVRVDAELSPELALTIFHPKTVLHDGGAIVKDGRLEGAACVFPVSQRELADRSIGLRHRAALGLAEQSDAVVLVVSEETGQLSIAYDGELERNLDPEAFVSRLREILISDPAAEGDEEEESAAPPRKPHD